MKANLNIESIGWIAVRPFLQGRSSGSDPSEPESVYLARALFDRAYKAYYFRLNARFALWCIDRLLASFSADDNSRMQEVVIRALFQRALILSDQSDFAEAIDIYYNIYDRCRSIGLYKYAAEALVNVGVAMVAQNKPHNVLAFLDAVLIEFDQPEQYYLASPIAAAKTNQGILQAMLGNYRQAFATYDDVISRFSQIENNEVREWVSMALVGKAICFGNFGNRKEEMILYDLIIERYSILEPSVAVCKAIFNKAIIRGLYGHNEAALILYDELIDRSKVFLNYRYFDLYYMGINNKSHFLYKKGEIASAYDTSIFVFNDLNHRPLTSVLFEQKLMAIDGAALAAENLGKADAALNLYLSGMQNYEEVRISSLYYIFKRCAEGAISIFRNQDRQIDAAAICSRLLVKSLEIFGLSSPEVDCLWPEIGAILSDTVLKLSDENGTLKVTIRSEYVDDYAAAHNVIVQQIAQFPSVIDRMETSLRREYIFRVEGKPIAIDINEYIHYRFVLKISRSLASRFYEGGYLSNMPNEPPDRLAKVLRQNAGAHSSPINVAKIAEKLGISIFTAEMYDPDNVLSCAELTSESGNSNIFINPRLFVSMRRLCVSFHIWDVIQASDNEFKADSKNLFILDYGSICSDIARLRFATCLLLPEDRFRAASTINDPESLCALYGVPLPLVRIRMHELELYCEGKDDKEGPNRPSSEEFREEVNARIAGNIRAAKLRRAMRTLEA